MSIEFRCGGCSNLLRVADEFVGKQARCPQCGQISLVPHAGEGAAAPTPAPSHFADPPDQLTQSPFAGKESSAGDNPYQSPGDAGIDIRQGSPYGRMYRQLGLASRWTRLAGAILDSLIHLLGAVPFGALGAFIGHLIEPNSEDAMFGMAMLLGAVGVLVVQIINWVLITKHGQSIAKRMLGMRIVTLDGRLPGFVNGVILRIWVPFAINQMCNLFGLLNVLWIFGDERRCIHDLIASTRVIDVRTEQYSQRSADVGDNPFRNM
jgi:uncharacterized RDD family membrane protein YckC